MLIVCPSCASEYSLTADALGSSGRTLRCASCRTTWQVRPDGSARNDAPLVEGRANPLRRSRGRAAASSRKRAVPPQGATPARSRAGIIAIGATVLLLTGAAFARTALVRAIPESAALFAAVGLPVNLVGLSLDRVVSTVSAENGDRVLLVEGEIGNPTRHAVRPVPVTITVESDAGQALYTWSAEARERDLAPGESTRFEARLASPPPDGRRVLVTFSVQPAARTVAAH